MFKIKLRPSQNHVCQGYFCQDHVCQDQVYQEHVYKDHVFQNHVCHIKTMFVKGQDHVFFLKISSI
jgi:hypothetical protein